MPTIDPRWIGAASAATKPAVYRVRVTRALPEFRTFYVPLLGRNGRSKTIPVSEASRYGNGVNSEHVVYSIEPAAGWSAEKHPLLVKTYPNLWQAAKACERFNSQYSA